MAKPSQRDIARAVLHRYPKSHADELGIEVSRNTPSPLYRWLLCALLFSTRISAAQAQKTAQALSDKGWRTPAKMAETSWKERVDVLNRSGYARYDESTARYIGETTDLLLDRYDGDLRNLREAAGRDPDRERDCLKAFKGIGDVGADIFFREVQLAWDELYPFADRKALEAAQSVGLTGDAAALARLVDRRDLPRLLSGLVRVDLSREVEKVREDA